MHTHECRALLRYADIGDNTGEVNHFLLTEATKKKKLIMYPICGCVVEPYIYSTPG
ncbi:hypothetical protein HanRHA438_Chr15g0716151 [Helianthus annuus]|nr:hypothetical protein HanRHA438_Chr15g0716151 [Helianthus annuus]